MELKPTLLFDGDCGFCRYWIARWRAVTGERVEYVPYQEAAEHLTEEAKEKFSRAVHLLEPDGQEFDAAEAVFRALAHAPGRGALLWWYQNVPGFAPISEAVYRLVASNRPFFSKATRLMFGASAKPPTFAIARWLFTRWVAVVFLVAFVSLWVQVDGLIGSHGILPARDYLGAMKRGFGPARYWAVPTLCWWRSSDAYLRYFCGAGAAAAALCALGVFQGPMLLACWALYLSLVAVGQEFLSFQWDILLLETGLLAAFLASWKPRDRLSRQSRPPAAPLWLLWWLLFRLMFESGAAKLASGDPAWRNFTALAYHYETQCLPTWIAWYAHRLPGWAQLASTAATLAIELVLPFLIFAPKRPRILAFAGLALLQVLIAATGNYCFFNLLALGLCVLLLDDETLRAALPKRWTPRYEAAVAPRRSRPRAAVAACLVGVILAVSADGLLSIFGESLPGVRPVAAMLQPLRSINRYGLFAVMTTVRNEIVIEGSDDGKSWKPYEFKWKPGDVRRKPAFVAPHQPRLDWQMWFAVLGSYQQNPWLIHTMARLLQNSKPVAALLAGNPFRDVPPVMMRAVVYRYRFTDAETRAKSGAWWQRELQGLYCPVISLRNAPPRESP
ncbi:MAG: lipase maturation factor family protein [Elusimicrobia bacterium]|nr:lipase maturation factor family protein [Elusimicrobiota bacterium]